MRTLTVEPIRSHLGKALCACALALAACGGGSETPQPVTLNITGSTSVSPFIRPDATAFTTFYPNVTLNVTDVVDSGSTAGIAAVGAGAVDIAMTSRAATAAEMQQYPDLVHVGVALDSINIALHPSNPVKVLSLGQVRDIYSGKITNWSGVGGPDLTIKVYHRKAPSGTRDYFLEGVMKGVAVTSSATLVSSSGMTTALTNDPSGIGYGKSDSVSALDVLSLQTDEGFVVAPTALNIRNGAYPLNRPLFLVTNGAPQGVAKSFIDYVVSDQGQKAVLAQALVSIR